ncbi:hypothetical protein ILYODFUR_026112, partial [Ilyodon furcidens]
DLTAEQLREDSDEKGSSEIEEPWKLSEFSKSRRALRWHINLQPWASEDHSLEDETKRFLSYITTPQVTCASLVDNEAATESSAGDWAVCLDPKFSLTHRMKRKHCRVYSFGWV